MHNALKKEINALSRKLIIGINKNSSVLNKYPIVKYIEFLKNYPKICDYNYVSRSILKYTDEIIQNYGKEILESYHKLLLVMLIDEAVDQLPMESFPIDIKDLYIKNFRRIIFDLNKEATPGDYLFPMDKFYKKLAICSFRLIPVGARKINLSKLPIKTFMFKLGSRQFLNLMFFMLHELKGIQPMYIGHLDTNDPDLLDEMNYAGLQKAYLRIIEMLKINNDVKGYFGTSWLLDPQLDKINKRHSYNREFVTSNGAKLFYKGPSMEALRNSLLKSSTRRRLYKDGKYIPTDYVIIWSRNKLFEWAEKYQVAN